jgi:hypothetical protein
MIKIVIVLLVAAIAGVAIWMAVLGVIAARYDATLTRLQKTMQILLSILVPFFGPAIVLYGVRRHSPDAIPESLVPWPFRSLIFGRSPGSDRDGP